MFVQRQIIIRHTTSFTIRQIPNEQRIGRSFARLLAVAPSQDPLHKSNYFIVDGTLLCYCGTHPPTFFCVMRFISAVETVQLMTSATTKTKRSGKKTHSLFNFCYIKQPHFLPFFSSEKEKFAHSNYILMMNSRREKIPKVKLCYSYFKVIQFNRQNTRHPQIKSTKFQITIHCIHRMCFSDQCRSCKFNKHWPLEFPVEIYILTTF